MFHLCTALRESEKKKEELHEEIPLFELKKRYDGTAEGECLGIHASEFTSFTQGFHPAHP